jgi:hypothetical protein
VAYTLKAEYGKLKEQKEEAWERKRSFHKLGASSSLFRMIEQCQSIS